MLTAALAALMLTGAMPPALTTANRVTWLDAETGVASACDVSGAEWRCDHLPASPRGIVVFVGDGELAFECVAVCANEERIPIRKWGRLLVLTPGGVAPDDLRGTEVTGWKPQRSSVRTGLRRFTAVQESGLSVTPVSSVAFWVAGDLTDPDSFVSIDGPLVGSTRVSVSSIAAGPPEMPVVVPAAGSFSLVGHVRASTGRDASGAEVELFEPLSLSEEAPKVPLDKAAMILRASTRSDADGAFVFERLAPGFYTVVASHSALGRGSAPVPTLGEPVVVRLASPRRVTGRVLRRQVPVSGTRVRLVPAPDVFVASADPGDLAAEDAVTGDDGRFALALPSRAAGAVQLVGPDGASTRVTLGGWGAGEALDLGDVSLPDPRRLVVRLLTTETCTMSAVGPVGALGLTIVKAVGSGGVYWFDLPEAGAWALGAECAGAAYDVRPRIVAVPDRGPDTDVDAHIEK